MHGLYEQSRLCLYRVTRGSIFPSPLTDDISFQNTNQLILDLKVINPHYEVGPRKLRGPLWLCGWPQKADGRTGDEQGRFGSLRIPWHNVRRRDEFTSASSASGAAVAFATGLPTRRRLRFANWFQTAFRKNRRAAPANLLKIRNIAEGTRGKGERDILQPTRRAAIRVSDSPKLYLRAWIYRVLCRCLFVADFEWGKAKGTQRNLNLVNLSWRQAFGAAGFSTAVMTAEIRHQALRKSSGAVSKRGKGHNILTQPKIT